MSTVVAIDFGTSRSAWALSIQGLAESAIVVRVPLGSDLSPACTKTETAVLLNTDDYSVRAFGCAAHTLYLEELEATEDSGADGDLGTDVGPRPNFTASDKEEHLPAGKSMLFRWFKMELCRKGGFQTVDDPVAISECGRTLPLLIVMAAVLRFFKDDALAHSSNVTGVDYVTTDVTWVVTIPAIYDDFARRFMRVAAHKAGLINAVDSPRLGLCLEPEAACLTMSIKDIPDLSQPGTRTMILDCGGGTVDITTHEVLSTNPLCLKELCPPKGGPWGSTYVDSEFMEWLKVFLGAEIFARFRRLSPFLDLLIQWEAQKIKFGGKDDEIVKLRMSAFLQTNGDQPVFDGVKIQELRDAYNNLHKDTDGWQVGGRKYSLVLPSPLVRSFFAPVIDKITACLDDLKGDSSLRDLKYAFLVGGFSSSPLVQAAARTSLEGDECKVIVAVKPEVAIVKGAVLFANDSKTFRTRKARLTYGVKTSKIFNPDDPEHCRRENTTTVDTSVTGAKRVYMFSRHIKIGDDIPQGGSCRKLCYRPGVPAQTEVIVEILASHEEDIEFADADTTCYHGDVIVPLDMDEEFTNRGVEVQFVFGDTELKVNCFRQTTGEAIGNATLQLHQEV